MLQKISCFLMTILVTFCSAMEKGNGWKYFSNHQCSFSFHTVNTLWNEMSQCSSRAYFLLCTLGLSTDIGHFILSSVPEHSQTYFWIHCYMYIYIHMYFLPFSGVNHSTLPLARRQMCLLLLSIWCSLKKGYLVGVCLYGSHITQSLREDLGDSISYSFSNCSCSTFFFFLSTAFHHAHDSSREESPLPLQLAFYVLLSKLGSFLLPEAHCISFKNKHTKSYFLFWFVIDLSRFFPHKNEFQIPE